jgi:hypothetical protein
MNLHCAAYSVVMRRSNRRDTITTILLFLLDTYCNVALIFAFF